MSATQHDPSEPARTPGERAADANPATATTSSYSLRMVAGVIIIVVFGGLPTVVPGRPAWAAIAGLVGVVIGFIMVAIAVNNAIKERRARRGQ